MGRTERRALRRFSDQCDEFAAELNGEGATPGGLEDGQERGLFYWSEADTAWQHGGDDDWPEFLGSVWWDEQAGRWAVEVQEHA